MPYALGIDLGGGRVTAAISRNDHERWLPPEVVAVDGEPAGVESVLHVTDEGAVEVGATALRALPARAGSVARGIVHRVGDEVPVVLGGRPYPAEVLAAALVGWVVDSVEAIEGLPPTQLVVTHPSGWGAHRRAVLFGSLREVGLPELTLLPRAVAAAESHAAAARVEVGEELAVHSLGAGRFEAAVLRRGSFGFELRAQADTVEPMGGDLFDDLLTWHVLAAVDPAPEGARLAKLRAACARAKERLSTETTVPVPGGPAVRRAEFEELIRPAVESTAQTLLATIRAAGGESVGSVVLVGGCGRVPLVRELVAAATRARVVVPEVPETAVARGAALAAARVAKPTVRAAEPAVLPEPIARSAVTHTDLMDLEDLPQEDLTDLGPPPPRPPVEITPLEPPKRRLLRLGGRSRTADAPTADEPPSRRLDREFADLDLVPARRRRRQPPPDEDDPAPARDVERARSAGRDQDHLPSRSARSRTSEPEAEPLPTDDPVPGGGPPGPARPSRRHPGPDEPVPRPEPPDVPPARRRRPTDSTPSQEPVRPPRPTDHHHIPEPARRPRRHHRDPVDPDPPRRHGRDDAEAELVRPRRPGDDHDPAHRHRPDLADDHQPARRHRRRAPTDADHAPALRHAADDRDGRRR